MRIKSIEIEGFKSFVHRTEIRFEDAIVGIVGPNGCGKSNVVDSIRWAMGEQSAKSLRGGKMEDVIFAGSANRAPHNFAEVSITFINQNGSFPPPYSELSELMITRRLHRSGESEYLINKVACRLKDITDLFLGTGSSPKAYSIIEQGRIDAFVMMRPEDRRNLIEEAAGISKFKQRKIAALRKMDATQANLVRIDDIIREVDRQRAYLKRQVQKAERFKRLSEELRAEDLLLQARRYLELATKIGEIQSGATSEHDEHLSLQSTVDRLTAEHESARLSQLRLEEEFSKLSTSVEQLRDDQRRRESELEISTRTVGARRQQIEERRIDIDSLRSRLSSSDRTRLELHESVGRLEKEIQAVSTELHARASTVDEVTKRQAESAAQLASAQAAVVELQLSLKESSLRLRSLQAELSEIEKRESEAVARRQELNRQREELINVERQIEEDRRSLHSERTELVAKRERLEGSVRELDRENDLEERRELYLMSEIDRTRSDLSMLQRLAAEDESFVKNRAELLEALTGTVPSRLIDQIKIEPGAERAVQVACAEIKKLWVLNDLSTVTTSTRSEPGDPETHFVLRPDRPSVPVAARNVTLSDGSSVRLTPVRTLVSTESEELSDVLNVLLSHVWVIDEPRFVARLGEWRELLHREFDSERVVLVHRSGDYLDSRGILCRDQRSARHLDAGRILQIDEEQRRFNARLKLLTGQLASTRLSIDELSAMRREQAALLAQAENALSELSRREVELTTRSERCRIHRDAMETESGTLTATEENLRDRRTHLESERRIGEESLSALRAEQDRRLSEVEEIEQRAALLARELERARDELTETRIRQAALIERKQAARQEIAHVEVAHNDFSGTIVQYEQDIALWEHESAALTEAVARMRDEIETGTRALHQETVALTERRTHVEAVRNRIGQLENELREKKKQLDAVAAVLGEQRLLERELELRMSHLLESVAERYRLDLRTYEWSVPELEWLKDPKADDDRVREWALSVEGRCQELKEKLEAIGEVNLLAISEHAELEQRFTFLSAQREDLVTALDRLKKVIDRINRITRDRFLSTFRAINHNFQAVFPRLFEGGKARLVLTDETNLLETGVDVVVQPPGKKAQTISLLSGGEKALTSVSLIFALFTYRPSSFCILDEVDAPLDEINTGRYNDIVREMSKLSQFILITHSKRTMESADVLYGVTMPEDGVSQVVSVRFSEAEKLLDAS